MTPEEIRALAGDMLEMREPVPDDLRDRVMRSVDRVRARRRRRPLLLSGLGGLAVSAAAIVAVVLAQQPARPGLNPDVTDVLNRAANVAGSEPELVPGAGQFVFTETRAWYPTATSSANSADGAVVTVYSWRSADGTRDGLVRQPDGPGARGDEVLPGCRDGKMEPRDRQGHPLGTLVGCDPDPGYVTGLPSTAEAMAKLLFTRGGGTARGAFEQVGVILKDHYLPPKSRALLFKAAALIPGVEVAYGVSDAAGRPGIAIVLAEDGVRQELVFDPVRFTFSGWQMRSESDGVNAMLRRYAVMRVAVTGTAGSLP
ncbi:CU044_5270 family protein [Longispora albida]|uniref:CU044_5270 family protein n=1 Tax=Longispora albida TaxID=203523 RepID=UPI00037CCDCA|nr:CU044_5270 family protein [Longispora albida]